MQRRDFLTAVGAVPLSLSLRTRASGRPAHQSLPHVVILGAGLAGMAAALQLREAGYQVTILEARSRAGGRVHTLRAPFADGLYADAGAARIQDSHDYTLRYVKQHNLTLDPFFPAEGQSVMVVAGKRLVTTPGAPPDLRQIPLPFSSDERAMGFGPALGKFLFSHVAAVGDPTAADWPQARDLSALEIPIAEFCRRNGASDGFTRMLAFGHDLSGMSALHLLRDAAVAARTKQWFKIRGGNDLLPAALARTLSRDIYYGAAVVRVRQDDGAVDVTAMRDRTPFTVRADLAISTLPTPVLTEIEISPALPPASARAIRELGALAMARVFLQTRERFWLARGHSGWASTDDPMDVWDYSRGQDGQRGILGAYLSGRIAHEVTALEERERGRFVAERMERAHPGLATHLETTASYSWISDPWARGASAEFTPGQLTRFYQTLRAPVGRLHFAGEHTSPWSGWMNGALESGHRAAAEILARRL